MVNIIKEELPIEESLKRELELICEFSKVAPTIINGNIRKIDKTNLTYIEPNRIIIKDKTFLIFNFSNEIFIENLSNKIKLSELEDAWVMATSSIKNNEVIIETLNNQIRNNEDMEQDKKDILIDTIQDLAYQNETNKQIIDILDENRFEEAKKMLEKIKMFLNKIQIFGFLCSTIFYDYGYINTYC